MTNILSVLITGFVLGLLYFETTKVNDTTFDNLIMFTSFYTIANITSKFLNIDDKVITNAFITKTVFTLIDERVRNKEQEPKNLKLN